MKKVKSLRKMFPIKIVLQGSKPPIWRRVIIPGDISLDKLHEIIQITMGWTDTHLHQFICNHDYYGLPDDDYMTEMKDETGVKISNFLKREKDKMLYEYDFGDDWLHEIILEKVKPFAGKTEICCLKGEGACPPEDCGGIHGYCHMLEGISNKNNPEYEDILEFLGEEFDPNYFELAETNEILNKYFNKD